MKQFEQHGRDLEQQRAYLAFLASQGAKSREVSPGLPHGLPPGLPHGLGSPFAERPSPPALAPAHGFGADYRIAALSPGKPQDFAQALELASTYALPAGLDAATSPNAQAQKPIYRNFVKWR